MDEEDNNGDYELDSDTSYDEEVFYGSDYGLADDDEELFDKNVDTYIEFDRVENNRANKGVKNDEDYHTVVNELATIDGLNASFDELLSMSSSSDDEGGSKNKKIKIHNI